MAAIAPKAKIFLESAEWVISIVSSSIFKIILWVPTESSSLKDLTEILSPSFFDSKRFFNSIAVPEGESILSLWCVSWISMSFVKLWNEEELNKAWKRGINRNYKGFDITTPFKTIGKAVRIIKE